jgi:hypothetical protein
VSGASSIEQRHEWRYPGFTSEPFYVCRDAKGVHTNAGQMPLLNQVLDLAASEARLKKLLTEALSIAGGSVPAGSRSAAELQDLLDRVRHDQGLPPVRLSTTNAKDGGL